MAILLPFNNFHLVARNTICKELGSGLFTPGTLAAMLGIKGGMNNFTPDDSIVLGRNTSKMEREAMKGTNQKIIPFMNTVNDDTKSVGYNDTDVQFNTALQMENNLTAQVSWGQPVTGISIDNQILKNAARQGAASGNEGGYLLNPIRTATREAMSRHMNSLASKLINGVPSNFNADIWGGTGGGDYVLGILSWISDRNNICSVDRTASTGAGFRAQYSTASLAPSLGLIDAVIVAGVANGLSTALPLPAGISYGMLMGTCTGGADGLHTTALNAKGSIADICLCSADVYQTLKQEAIATQNLVNVANSPAAKETTYLGFKAEYFQYNRTTVALDYYLPAKTMMILDSSSFVLEFDELMDPSPFTNLPEVLQATGQMNRTTSKISSRIRFYCEEPWKNFLATNVA